VRTWLAELRIATALALLVLGLGWFLAGARSTILLLAG